MAAADASLASDGRAIVSTFLVKPMLGALGAAISPLGMSAYGFYEAKQSWDAGNKKTALVLGALSAVGVKASWGMPGRGVISQEAATLGRQYIPALKGFGTAPASPMMGNWRAQIGAVGDVKGVKPFGGGQPAGTMQADAAVGSIEISTKSRMAELGAKWGHMSAAERRALLELKVEGNAERWVKNYQDQLNGQYPGLNAHFWDKHAPDIPLSNVELRAIDGTHPRFGTSGRISDSSQFGDFKTMMDVLNEATTRQARGLSLYNVANRPSVYGTFEGSAGWGFLKVPGAAPSGTRPTFVPSYSGWLIRFDSATGAPYTAYPTW